MLPSSFFADPRTVPSPSSVCSSAPSRVRTRSTISSTWCSLMTCRPSVDVVSGSRSQELLGCRNYRGRCIQVGCMPRPSSCSRSGRSSRVACPSGRGHRCGRPERTIARAAESPLRARPAGSAPRCPRRVVPPRTAVLAVDAQVDRQASSVARTRIVPAAFCAVAVTGIVLSVSIHGWTHRAAYRFPRARGGSGHTFGFTVTP